MSLFKKPVRKFRHRTTQDSDDEDSSSKFSSKSSYKDIPFFSGESEKKVDSSKHSAAVAQPKLSFDDEEESSEVFKVKKTSYSRRLAKQSQKEKKKKPIKEVVEEKEANDLPNEFVIKYKALKKTDKNDAEIVEEVLADDEFKDEEDTYDPFLNILQGGVIPDAATIYAMKKKRQMARELGDFVPLEEESRPESSSRLTRDDDDDDDEEDDESRRINFLPSKNEPKKEAFIEEENDNVDADDVDKWETEQIRKGVSIAQGQAAQIPTPSSSEISQKHTQSYEIPAFTKMSLDSKDEKTIKNEIKQFISDQLKSVKDSYEKHKRDKVNCEVQMTNLKNELILLQSDAPVLTSRFELYQELNAYVNDLIECLDSKVATIEILEKNHMELLKEQTEMVIFRRQQDVKDQSEEVAMTIKRNPVIPGLGDFTNDGRSYRAAEREGRRMRRRRNREASTYSNSKHNDGTSSDDEILERDVLQFRNKQQQIFDQATSVFEDVVEEFGTFGGIMAKFEAWRQDEMDSYRDAYVPLCLSKLFGPLIRVETLSWNPLEEGADIENMKWYKSLVFYGYNEEMNESKEWETDPDVNLIPSIVEKVVLAKITEFVNCVWDPLSTTQTLQLVKIIKKLTEDYPTITAKSKNVQAMLSEIAGRIQKSLEDDVFIPFYTPEILNNRLLGANAFFQRQFWSCYKLLRNVLAFSGILSDRILQDFALNGILNRYMLFALKSSDDLILEKCKTITSTLPRAWFASLNGENTLPQLELFCCFLKQLAAKSATSQKEEDKQFSKDVIKILVTLGAKNHAFSLASHFSLKELKTIMTV